MSVPTSSEIAHTLRGPLRAVIAWCYRTFSLVLPNHLRFVFTAFRRYTIFEIDATTISVITRYFDHERELVRFPRGHQPISVPYWLRRRIRRRVLIRIVSNEVLQTTLDLPAAAEENLAEILALDMDRITPFRVDQVYFGYRLVHNDTITRRLRLTLTVLARDVVDAAIKDTEHLCARVASVKVSRDGTMPEELGTFGICVLDDRCRRFDVFAALLCVAMTAAAVWYPIAYQQSKIAKLRDTLMRVQAEAEKSIQLHTRIVDSLMHQDLVTSMQHTYPLSVAILAELANSIPDHSWVVELYLRKKTLTINGYSSDVQDLVRTLTHSSRFELISQEIVAYDGELSQSVRFSVEVRVIWENGQ